MINDHFFTDDFGEPKMTMITLKIYINKKILINIVREMLQNVTDSLVFRAKSKVTAIY